MTVKFRLVATGAALLLFGSLLLAVTGASSELPVALALVAGLGTVVGAVRAGSDRTDHVDRPL